MAYKNVIQVGAAGALGGPILDAIVQSNKFNVSVLTRPSSKSTYPDHVNVVKADFDSHADLVNAFRGQDVVIMTTGDFHNVAKISIPLIDAAIEAGVKRFIPSGWGYDLYSGPGSWQELLIPKYKVRDYLNKKAAEGKITWTTVATGLFFDWSFDLGLFYFDYEKKTVKLFDEGNQKIMMTTLSSIGDSVVGILSQPDLTKNKLVRIHDFFASNEEVVQAVEEVTGKKYEIGHISTEELTAQGKAMPPGATGVGLQALALFWGPARAAEWEEDDDSASLGLKKKDIKEETARSLRKLSIIP